MQLKTYHIKTFGCQMNYADSEKIDMILRSAGLRKVLDPVQADIVIMNTCSVRQKGEDKVFGFMKEISRYHRKDQTDTGTDTDKQRNVLFGITGCMVRKSGVARRYIDLEHYKRQNADKIVLLESSDSLVNYDDELFLRSEFIDFTFRIEEVSFVTKILSLISGNDIGNDAKFNEYLAVKQLQENPSSANIIIQTGCDNFCTFCIVPHTRGRETSRGQEEIVSEIREVVSKGTKEVTLLGQNVNSYGKETRAKLWNSEELTWERNLLLKGGADEGSSENSPLEGLGVEVSLNSPLGGVPTLGGGVEVSTRKYEKEILDGPSWGKDSLFPYWNLPKNKNLEENARKLRKAGILSEVRFWQYFKDKEGLAFDIDRQVIIGDYIVDLFIPETGLIFEINDSSHEEKKEYDKKREDFLISLGLQVIHFSGYDILDNPEGIYEKVIGVYEKRVEELRNIHPALRAPLNEGNESTEQSPRPSGTPQRGEGISRTSTPVFDHPSREEGTLLTPFRELLEEINSIDGLDRIRFTSSNPHDMTKDILDAHFDLPKMCPYLHFALQSGSDTMLKRMNRKHTYADFKMQLEYLRSRDPLFSISTDIIVGFPGETEEEFQATATAMRECQFDFAFIARYNPRSGTVATAKYQDDITPEEKARRWTILNDILRETVHTRNILMVGREEEILISGEGKDDTWVGRTRNWKEVFIEKDTGIEKKAPLLRGDTAGREGGLKVGDLVKVRITEGDGWVLKGERI